MHLFLQMNNLGPNLQIKLQIGANDAEVQINGFIAQNIFQHFLFIPYLWSNLTNL